MFGAEAAGGHFGADWNGGHTFSQSAVDFSLQEYIEPEVIRKNPHLSPDEVRLEASRVLTLRLAQDLSFDRKETLRDEEMVTKWEVADIDGKKQLVTRYGDRNVSLEELWRHTEDFALRVGKPAAFNRAEMQTQLAIQDALITGRATSALFTLSHPESVRYLQQWQMREDGVFYSRQIDIGKHAGRDLRHDEVKGFLDSFRDQHRDTAIEVEGAVAGSYIAMRGAIDTAVMTRSAMLQTLTSSVESFDRRRYSSGDTSRHIPDLSDRVNPFWVVADRRWFEENKKEDYHIVDRIVDNVKKDIPRQTKSIDTQEKPSIIHTTPTPKEGSNHIKILRKEYDTRRTAANSLQFIAETGIALHAAPVILARLAEKLPVPIRAVEKSIRRHAEKVRKVREGRKSSGKAQPLQAEKVDSLEKGKEQKKRKKRAKGYREKMTESHKYALAQRVGQKERGRRVKQDKENRVKKVATAEKLTPIEKKSVNPERRRIRRLQWVVRRTERILEAKRVPKKEKKLWVALAVAAWEFNPTRFAVAPARRANKPIQPMNGKMKRLNDAEIRTRTIVYKEKEVVAGVRFAWVVWMLLQTKNEAKQTLDPRLRGDDRRKRGDDRRRRSDDKEKSAPWVLLSIIWYLTAIREQGIQNYPMKKKRRTLPKQGVIFAFAS